MVNKITSWSYSKYSNWKSCPRKYKHAYIDKIPQPRSPAAERGTMIHAKGEHYLLGDIRGVPPEYKKFACELRAMKRAGVTPEEKWSLSNNWKPCEWEDYSRIWLRALTDVHHYDEDDCDLSIIDFKTGRQYPSHKGQGELYATMGLSYYPELQNVSVEFWYLDSGEVLNFDYDLKKVKSLKTLWIKRSKLMLADRKFLATPSEDSCRWCPFKASKGGPCNDEF